MDGDANANANAGESALVRSLNQQIERLTGESTRRKAALQGVLKAMGVRTAAEANQLLTELGQHGNLQSVMGEYRRLKASPDQLQADVERLQQDNRTLRHKEGIRELYQDKELGLNPAVPVDRLIALAGYRPESDQFDPKPLKARLAAMKATDPYLFGAGSATTTPPPAEGTPRPSWADRGSSEPVPGRVELTDAQIRDPAFMCGPGATFGTKG